MEEIKIKEFLADSGSGDGSGYGSGYGYGSGDGSGAGAGSGSGAGSGDGSGYGYGDGYDSGSGSGDGDGYGYGDGYDSGSGSGDGDGYGYGDGYGLEELNCEKIYKIDGVETILRSIRGSVAKGAIVNRDLTLSACFIVKQGNVFAHGETLHAAMEALRDKLYEDMPEEERIEAFMEAHELYKAYPNRDLYDWHHRLTGSCDMGRQTFVKNHGIDMDGKTTVLEFIRLTEHEYGGEVIKRLKERYEDGCK